MKRGIHPMIYSIKVISMNNSLNPYLCCIKADLIKTEISQQSKKQQKNKINSKKLNKTSKFKEKFNF